MPGFPAARIGDMHVCPMVTGVVPHVGGPIMPPCAVTVLTGGMPQARVGDMLTCVGPPDVIALGSFTVLVVGQPAARILDTTVHGGSIIIGLPTVLIGGGGGGNGGGAGGGAGMGSGAADGAAAALSAADAMIAPAQQAAVYKAAAKAGTPFCERCSG